MTILDFTRRLATCAVATAAFGLMHGCATPAGELGTLTIDDTQTYQTMTGWEITARVWEYDKQGNRFDPSWEIYSDQIFDMLVDEAGIDRLRIEVRSGSENPVDYWRQFERGEIGYRGLRQHFYEKINDNDDPFVTDPDGYHFSHLDYQVEKILLPLKQRLDARGKRLRVNLCFVDFKWTDLKGNFELAENPDEYSELILAAFQHLHDKYGLTPDMLEIILEPDNTDRWRGWQIGKAVVNVKARLDKAGYTPDLIAPSTANSAASRGYFRDLSKVPGAAEALSVYAYHRYDGSASRRSLGPNRHLAHKHGLRTEMLEYTRGTFDYLYEDLTLSDASAWQLYMIARQAPPSDVTRAVMIDVDTGAAQPTLRLSERGRYIAQLTRFVETEATRMGIEGGGRGLAPVAFRNADGRDVIVFKTDRGGKLELHSLDTASYEVRYTSGGVTNRLLGLFDASPEGGLSLSVPAAGVYSVVEQQSRD